MSSIPRLQLPSLKGLGDRWEGEVKARFGREAETYVPPTPQELVEVGQLASGLQAGQVDLERAARLGLQLTEIATPAERFLLLEDTQRGWGKVLYRLQPRQELAIQVPHPVFDGGTPELGVELFERTGAQALVLAGAHRWNRAERAEEQPDRGLADAAHTTSTFFHAIHETLSGPVLQLHGFRARGPEEPEVFLSDGQDDGHDPAPLVELRDSLQAQGFRPFIVDFQEDYLTARTNVQAQQRRGQDFIHMEVSDSIRRGPERAAAFERVGQAVEGWLLK